VTIRHRGPDSSGTWISADNRVGESQTDQNVAGAFQVATC
jgi:asparagine synthetase B (glutamine-hydrolysing)